jgi:hypothetical protein
MRSAAYLYPWDIVGDPAAPALMAGLGVDHVVLAAVYHGIRAMTLRHPRHRVVTVPHSAAYYPSDQGLLETGRWSFEEACAALRRVGLPVHAWVVFSHVDLPYLAQDTVVNAYGDRYPWALCPARPAVLDYATGIATEVAGLPGISGVELEACGWYGFDHLGAHDKTSGVPLDTDHLSLCFCDVCCRSYVDSGLDPSLVRSGSAPVDDVLAVRSRVADRFRAAVVGAIRARRPDLEILLHTNPLVSRSTAFTGADPARVASLVDGRVVNCWTGFEPLVTSLRTPGPVYASLLARSLPSRIALLPEGTAGIRIYHAGLATDAELDAIRALKGTSG